MLKSFQDKVWSFPPWVCGYNSLQARHQDIAQDFHNIMKTIIPENNYYAYRIGDLKDIERIKSKATVELGGNLAGIDDVVRGTFVVNSFSDMQEIDRILEDFGKTYCVTPHQRRDGFEKKPNQLGRFRSIMYKFDFGNGIKCEIQLSIRAFDDIYDESHELYAEIRDLAPLSILSREQYHRLLVCNINKYLLHRNAWLNVREEYFAIYGRGNS